MPKQRRMSGFANFKWFCDFKYVPRARTRNVKPCKYYYFVASGISYDFTTKIWNWHRRADNVDGRFVCRKIVLNSRPRVAARFLRSKKRGEKTSVSEVTRCFRCSSNERKITMLSTDRVTHCASSILKKKKPSATIREFSLRSFSTPWNKNCSRGISVIGSLCSRCQCLREIRNFRKY